MPLTVGELEDITGCLFRITDIIVKCHRPGTEWYWEKLEVEQFFSILQKGRFPQTAAASEELAAK